MTLWEKKLAEMAARQSGRGKTLGGMLFSESLDALMELRARAENEPPQYIIKAITFYPPYSSPMMYVVGKDGVKAISVCDCGGTVTIVYDDESNKDITISQYVIDSEPEKAENDPLANKLRQFSKQESGKERQSPSDTEHLH